MVQAWSQGAGGPGARLRADVHDDLQGNSWALSASLSFPSRVFGEWVGRGAAGGWYRPPLEGTWERGPVLPP